MKLDILFTSTWLENRRSAALMRIVASIWLSDRRCAAFDNLNLGQISYEKLVYRGKRYRREIPLQKKKFEGYLRGWFAEEIDKGVKALCTGRNLRST